MLPEQCGNWAYPSSRMTLAETRFTMLNGIVGRLYLSGYLTRMAPEQLAVVHEGVRVHKQVRAEIAASVPFWPLGLPAWEDDVVALGLLSDDGSALLALWGKHGLDPQTEIALRTTRGLFSSAEQLFGSDATTSWDAAGSVLHVTPAVPDQPFAALLRLSA